MLSQQPVRPGQTVGADRGYDVSNFVDRCREIGFTPHVAQRQHSRIDERTTRHEGYTLSQRKRKRVEQPCGWMKTIGLLHKLRHRGRDNVAWLFRFTATAYKHHANQDTGGMIMRPGTRELHPGGPTGTIVSPVQAIRSSHLGQRKIKSFGRSTAPLNTLLFQQAARMYACMDAGGRAASGTSGRDESRMDSFRASLIT